MASTISDKRLFLHHFRDSHCIVCAFGPWTLLCSVPDLYPLHHLYNYSSLLFVTLRHSSSLLITLYHSLSLFITSLIASHCAIFHPSTHKTGVSTGDLVRSILEDDPPAIPAHYSQSIKAIASAFLLKDMNKRMGMAGG